MRIDQFRPKFFIKSAVSAYIMIRNLFLNLSIFVNNSFLFFIDDQTILLLWLNLSINNTESGRG